ACRTSSARRWRLPTAPAPPSGPASRRRLRGRKSTRGSIRNRSPSKRRRRDSSRPAISGRRCANRKGSICRAWRATPSAPAQDAWAATRRNEPVDRRGNAVNRAGKATAEHAEITERIAFCCPAFLARSAVAFSAAASTAKITRYSYGLRRPWPVSSRAIGFVLPSAGRQVSSASLPVPGPFSCASSTSPGEPPSLATSAFVESTWTSTGFSSAGLIDSGLQVLVLVLLLVRRVVYLLEVLVFVRRIDDVFFTGPADVLVLRIAFELIAQTHLLIEPGKRTKPDPPSAPERFSRAEWMRWHVAQRLQPSDRRPKRSSGV